MVAVLFPKKASPKEGKSQHAINTDEMSTTTKESGWYQHDTAANMLMFVTKVKGEARGHSNAELAENMGKLIKGDTVEATKKDAANVKLFDILTKHIASSTLIQTLAQSYEDDGAGALKYIKSAFHATADNNRLEVNHAEYRQCINTKHPDNITSAEIRAVLNHIISLRNNLNGTDREIPDKILSWDMIDMIRLISEAHALELKFIDFKPEDTAKPANVLITLENIVHKVQATSSPSATSNKNALTAMLTDAGVTADEIKALLTRTRNVKEKQRSKCPMCGVPHGGQCYAQMLAEGKTPPGFDKLPADNQSRLRDRGQEIKDKGPFKDRPVVMMTAPRAVAMAAQPAAQFTIHVDSKAGTGYEYRAYIADGALFVTQTALPTPISIGGIGQGAAMATHIGTIGFVTADGVTAYMSHCLYVPNLGYNLYSVYAGYKFANIRTTFNDVNAIESPAGTIHFSPDNYDFAVRPLIMDDLRRLPPRAQISLRDDIRHLESQYSKGMFAGVTSVQRPDGKLHIDLDKMSQQRRAEFDLVRSRLNDPGLARMKSLPQIAKNVPDVVREANPVNTMPVDRAVANPPTKAARQDTTPVPDKPGKQTCIDIMSLPCTGLLGNKMTIHAYDPCTKNFELYLMRAKSQSPSAVAQYFVDAASRGLTIEPGGVLHSDNEIVLNSGLMREQAEEPNKLIHTNSVEYRPTGNAGVESTNRLLTSEMRKIHVRAQLPDEFWEFTAMAAQD